MPIRIYALAKELKVDSKELVDLCAKAGITGKGSALASLDDAEVAKVKEFLSGGSAPAPKPPPAMAAPERPSKAAVLKKPKVLPPTPSVSKPARPSSPKAAPLSAKAGFVPVDTPPATIEEPEAEVVPAEPPPEPASPEEPVAPVAETSSEPQPYTRDDYIAPVKSGKIKVIGSAGKRESGEEGKPDKVKKRQPVISLAKIPQAKQPQKPAASNEPPAQKPEIRLPKDAITGRKGGRAPLEHLTKTDKPQRKGGPPASPAAGNMPVGDAPLGKAAAKHRKGKGSGEEGERGLAGLASARADRQKARRSRAKMRVNQDDDQHRSRRRRTLTRKGTNTAAPRKGKVALELPCTVRSFSEAAGVPSAAVQKVLMGLGVMATINAHIEDEQVGLIAEELGVELEFKQKASLEDSLISEIQNQEDAPDAVVARPPVITFLGHVDHGKTSLLDRILGINVVSGEAGGITQHIRAYKIQHGEDEIAFVDTPGHEAFTEMRARGANVTDIAVLVVAADDGVMPQTEEAISHAKAAEVPIVVAMNKMDLPGANPNQVMQQLAAKELLPSEWGGDVEVIACSAMTGEGVEDLLETLMTLAELHEYQANPERSALGVCLESEQESGRGVVAKLMIQNGTLNVGDVIVCGTAHGKVKAMFNTLDAEDRLESAGPSTPVNVTGLDQPPLAGDAFYVLDDITQARQIAEQRADRSHELGLSGQTIKVSFDRFQELLNEGRLGQTEEVATLNLIIRADVQGSIEAITKELEKLEHPEVQIKILQKSVGGVTVGDVHLANASNAVIIGFNVIPDEAARILAEDRTIEIRRYDVIYKVTDDIKAMLEGKLKPEERVVELGRALVKQVFPISRVGTVAGCYVAQGQIERGCRVRVNRDGRTIGDYELESLRRERDDIKEVPRGMECGMKLNGFNDVKQDDILEAYRIEEVARTL